MSDVKNKIVHELSIEELLEIAKGAKPEDTFGDKVTEAARFIYDLKIRAGTTKISGQLVYWHYKSYKGFRNTKQPKPLFYRDFNKYFKVERNKHGTYYNLDPAPFDLSKENYWLMVADKRNKKHRRKTK